MRIAVICPVGPLDRFGYQYNHELIVQNLCIFSDRVYLFSSSRNRSRVDSLLDRFANLTYLSDERTWFSLDAHQREVFDLLAVERNQNLALACCREDDIDCAIVVHINQYVQAANMPRLRQVCQDMLADAQPWAWLYRKYQLRDRLFHTSVRLPWILNLRADQAFQIATDSIRSPKGEVLRMEQGFWPERDGVSVVDCGMELTVGDLADIRNFTRCYADINPDADPEFSWDHYRSYYARKYRAMVLSREPLDITGSAISRNSHPDFVSGTLLKECRKLSFRRAASRLVRRWRPGGK